MFDRKQFNWIFTLAIILALISYFSGFLIDVTRDCGKYATIAKEIYMSGDFLNLTIHGDAYDQKPPLLFWLGAVGFYIGGVSNFWFKFPVFLIMLFGVYSTYRLGKSLYNKNTGQIAATMLFFSGIYTLYSMDIHTDTLVQAFAAFSMWQLYEFIQTKKNINWILGFIGIGLAILCKGPMGAVVPAFAIVGHILLKKQYHLFKDIRWLLGLIISFIMVSPILVSLYNQFGVDGIKFFFWDNNIGRFTGGYTTTYYDPTLYIHSTLYLFIPWSVLLCIAVYNDIRERIRNKFIASEHFTFTGIWIFFIILSISRSMLPNYVFILVPLMAILTAKWVDKIIKSSNKHSRMIINVQLGINITTWIVIILLSNLAFAVTKWYVWLLGSLLLALTYYVYKHSKTNKEKIILPTIITYTTLSLILSAHIFPQIFNYQAPPKAAHIFNSKAKEGGKLYNYSYGQYELFFYSTPQALQIHNSEELTQAIQEPNSWIFTNPNGLDTINSYNPSIDTIYNLDHLYLNSGWQFILSGMGRAALKPMYLVKLNTT